MTEAEPRYRALCCGGQSRKLTGHYECVDPGWAALLTLLHLRLEQLDPAYEVVQVKEKFGGLRAYIISESREAQDLTNSYTSLSEHVCEMCGKEGECAAGGRFWMKTLCEHCRTVRHEERAEA